MDETESVLDGRSRGSGGGGSHIGIFNFFFQVIFTVWRWMPPLSEHDKIFFYNIPRLHGATKKGRQIPSVSLLHASPIVKFWIRHCLCSSQTSCKFSCDNKSIANRGPLQVSLR